MWTEGLKWHSADTGARSCHYPTWGFQQKEQTVAMAKTRTIWRLSKQTSPITPDLCCRKQGPRLKAASTTRDRARGKLRYRVAILYNHGQLWDTRTSQDDNTNEVWSRHVNGTCITLHITRPSTKVWGQPGQINQHNVRETNYPTQNPNDGIIQKIPGHSKKISHFIYD